MNSVVPIAAVTPLSEDISQVVKELQKIIQSKFDDQYMGSLGGITWDPHLTFIQTTVYTETLDQSLIEIKKVLQTMPKLRIIIEKLVIEEGKDTDYIFFTLDQNTFNKLLNIRSVILDKIKDLRKDAVPNKYQDRWESLTEEEKKFLIDTGHKYRFEPHISITKLPNYQTKDAYEFILPKAQILFGKEFHPTKVILQKEDVTSEKRWRDIETIELSK
jgi:hypothetical protein